MSTIVELAKLAHEYRATNHNPTEAGFVELLEGAGSELGCHTFDALIACEGLTIADRREVANYLRKAGERDMEHAKQLHAETNARIAQGLLETDEQPPNLVKALFNFPDMTERMWVKVTGKTDTGRLIGTLDNHPCSPLAEIQYGDEIEFDASDVICESG